MPDRPRYVSDDEVNPKTRLGQKKPSISAVPMGALMHCAMAMMDGVDKYGLYNWREKDVPARIYIDAIYRHLACWTDGEERASDSHVHHLGHIMACCAILLDAQAHGCLIDDRGIPGTAPDVIAELSMHLQEKATGLDVSPPIIVNRETDNG